MDLSTVGGWLACRGAGQYSNRYGKIEDMVTGLEVVLADGTTVRTGGRGPAVGHRPRPHPAVRGQRGDARGDHRGPLPGPPGARGRRPAGLRLPELRGRARRLPSHPAPGGRARPSSASTTRPSRSATSSWRAPAPSSCSTRAIPPWSTPPWPWSTRSARTADALDASARRPVAGPPQRRLRPRPPVARRHRGRHRGGGGPVAGASRPLPLRARRRHRRRGTLVVSSHQSHAYPDGACLYFTFAGRPPTELGRRGRGGRWAEDYYRKAWDAAIGATGDGGRSHQPPPRHRPQPERGSWPTPWGRPTGCWPT